MKRLFILATAAIVAFASCSKTQVVYNDAPEEIGFKTVPGVMTKADFEGSMGVYAETASDFYFKNAQFSEDGTTGIWAGGKYWPITGELTFTVYSPYEGTEVTPGAVSYDNTTKKLTIAANNSGISTQKDWLYGTTQPSGTKETAADEMPVVLAHALSKIIVNIKGDANVKVKKVEIFHTYQVGTGTVTYTSKTAGTPSWVPTQREEKMALFEEVGGTALSSTDILGGENGLSCLVIPTATLSTEAIKLTYVLTGAESTELTFTTKTVGSNQLGTTWKAGSQYTYNFTVGAKEIKFEPTVDDWVLDDDVAADGNNSTGIDVTPNIM